MAEPAIDRLSADERAVFVRMLAAAALAHALCEDEAINDERPERLEPATGRDVHDEGDREQHELYSPDTA
jgi:hypothetical protein